MKRHSRITTKTVLIIISVVCLLSMVLTFETRTRTSYIEQSVTSVIIPFQKGVTYFGDWIRARVEFLTNINELDKINEDLLTEVSQLRYENKLLESDKLELERLRELFELDKRYADFPKTGARVIGKDPGSWYDVFIIDKGSDDQIEVNMVVMAGNGLVGRIIEVAPNYAKVRSIIDDTSSVSGKILRTSDLCTVSGEKKLGDDGLCLVEYIENDSNIVVGDEIVTSHLGKIYPPGILIGTIRTIENNPDKLTKTAVLEPVVDFKHLEEVLVIKLSEVKE
ncbi:MAG: rod shape-determining protein MreC [Vallitaleaceae bacterium]|nr:rod shape-determining protein MreC [Vallitaleaceae bacterium]